MSPKTGTPIVRPPGANLYCSGCDSQIGIFDNSWNHLTKSYAYSTEKGIEFGTQTGANTQIVPHGARDNSAVGCTMAQVFCKKCSSLLGQFCKTVSRPDQSHLLHQQFYKLSRTYLKDARTSARLEYHFVDDDHVPSAATSAWSTATPLSRLPSMNSGSATPLHHSLPPPGTHTQKSHLMLPPASAMPAPVPDLRQSNSSTRSPDVTQEIVEHGKTIAEWSRSLSLVDTRAANLQLRFNEQGQRFANLAQRTTRTERQLNEHGVMLDKYDMNFTQHDTQLDAMKAVIEKQEQQLADMKSQLESIKTNMDGMKAIIESQHLATMPQNTALANNHDFISSLEAMLASHKESQTTTAGTSGSREDNRASRPRLSTATKATGIASDIDTPTIHYESDDDFFLVEADSLGKRKRGPARDDSKRRKRDSRQVSAAQRLTSVRVPQQFSVTTRETTTQPDTNATSMPEPTASAPENIDFSDEDEPDVLHGLNDKAGGLDNSRGALAVSVNDPSDDMQQNGQSTVSKPSSTKSLLPASIMAAVRALNKDAQRLSSTTTDPEGETSKTGRKPLVLQPNTKVSHPRKSDPVRKLPQDTTPRASPAVRGRPRKSMPLTHTSIATVPRIAANSATSESDLDQDNEFESENACTVCGAGGKLLCCNTCPKVYHHRCLVPRLNPKIRIEGDWHCPTCVEKQNPFTNQHAAINGVANASADEHHLRRAL